jgi:uncharacterized protein (UPF0332 family)
MSAGGGEVARVAGYWLALAGEALASARAERMAGRYNFACNRAYYAAFYAASAALLRRGRHFVKHAGLRTAVHRDLVNAGLLNAKWAAVFDRLFESRQRADYVEMAVFGGDETDRLIADAAGFVAEMRRLMEQDKG